MVGGPLSPSNGKLVPVVTYVEPGQEGIAVGENEVKQDLQKLEMLYGHFPHAYLTLYFGRDHVDHFNDMKYAGADVTTVNSLYHELSHSYFARPDEYAFKRVKERFFIRKKFH